jgi:hypothetical protein
MFVDCHSINNSTQNFGQLFVFSFEQTTTTTTTTTTNQSGTTSASLNLNLVLFGEVPFFNGYLGLCSFPQQ